MLFDFYIDEKGENETDDHNVWGVSELAAVSVYQTDFCASDWPIGYSELEPRRQDMKKMYQKRADWQSYLDKAVVYFKKNPLNKAGEKCSR
jgi:hypothetical protein